VLYPGRCALNTALVENLPLLLVGLLLIPLQTSAEEVFVRGYLLQATGRLTRNPLLLSVMNGVLFTLPHLANPEAAGQLLAAALSWFTFGVLFTLVTLRSGSLDYALGMHAGNNLFPSPSPGTRAAHCRQAPCSSPRNSMRCTRSCPWRRQRWRPTGSSSAWRAGGWRRHKRAKTATGKRQQPSGGVAGKPGFSATPAR
jgi:hypothetical protein